MIIARVRRRASHRLFAVLAVVVLCALIAVGGRAPSAGAAGTVKLTGYGADSCTAPSTSQMKAFWSNTPYSYWGIYIGGSDRGCSQPNLTRSWVSAMITMGWDLLPIWVGPQNPCTSGQASYFSTNTSTAYGQGVAQAKSAYSAWTSLSSASDVPITYDLEAPSSNSSTCRAAAKSFVDGWDAQLAGVAPAQVAGVYSSSCAGDIDDFATITHKPNYIDAADWDGSPSTGSISCISSSHWSSYQRHKQYQGGHNATYNGVTLNIDSDCANGPVYGAASRTSSTQACAPGSAASRAAVRQDQAATAPVSWHGVRWTAGGPLSADLFRGSGDGASTATAVQVGEHPVVLHDVSPSAATVGTPAVLADGSLLVPMTAHSHGTTRELLFTTTDGRHFTRRASIALHGASGAGVAMPTSVLSGQRVFVLEPDGKHAAVWSGSSVRHVSVAGLPAGASSVDFSSSSHATATAETTRCSAAKATCAPTTRSYRTTNGGRSWQ